MSRAINLNASHDDVIATCTKLGVGISTIEALKSGGTRVVLNNSPDAAAIVKAYGSKVLEGPVQRAPTRLGHW